jgi:tetratricopeptide (TPR) repeat protein
VKEEFFVPQAGQAELIVPFYTGKGCRLSGVIPVPLPAETPKGTRVRIKFKVDHDKVLHWWYSIGTKEFEQAPKTLQDPWSASEMTPRQRQVLKVRRKIRDALLQGGQIPDWLEIEEIITLYRADEIDEAELLAMEMMGRTGLTANLANALSLIYGDRRDRPKELHYAREAVRLDPKIAIFLGNLGYTLAAMKNLNEALPALRRALAIDPELAYVYETIGDVLREQADEPAALREYAEAIRLFERRAAGTEPDPLWALQRLYQKTGDYDNAREIRTRLQEAGLNERYSGDHRHRIAGPDSGF